MAKSIFNNNDNEEIIKRINKLTPQSQALWGKMNVAQMFVHLQMATKLMIGEIKMKKGLLGILFSSVAKKIFINSKPFPKNLMTDKSFKIVEQKQFEEEKKHLIALIKQLPAIHPSTTHQSVHPIFGKLTFKEWDILQWKHIDHHLRQFGA